ncbi:MAG: SIS domain-containing protein [Chloroflexota bacterium]|nr:SIS domain-containing protein [Chloroflexota bacterium]
MRPRALQELLGRRPELECAAASLARAYDEIAHSQEAGGTLFLAGNGGSMADGLHISGELLKSYKRPRPLTGKLRQRLAAQPEGEILAQNLEGGLRAVVLGINPSLASAVANDNPERDMGLAQELLALARPDDVLLGISTSGTAQNVRYAASVAQALGLATIALTGADGGPLAERADIAIRTPAHETDRVQEQHIALYHCLCEMLEERFFGEEAIRARSENR